MSQILKIGTYNGTFHCYEVLACFMLKQLPEYKDATIVRTRDEQTLNTCDIVLGVGNVFDASRNRFDHHQGTFTDTMHSLNSEYKWTTKLSSAGLVYYHFGSRIIAGLVGMPQDSTNVKKIYNKVYENFIEEIDAMSNGVTHCSTEPRYHITTNLNARITRMNPQWNEKRTDEDYFSAMSVAGAEFTDRLHWYAKSWIPARDIVLEAINKRAEIDSSEEIIVFEMGGCPWKDHLFELEEELNLKKSIKFILYPAQNESWRVQCVNIRPGSYQTRLPLPEKWRGLNDKALASLSGLDDAIFVHATGFIGGCRSRQSTLTMAKKALEQA